MSGIRVAIIGAGQVGEALGNCLLKRGHQVKFGSRDPTSEKVQASVAKVSGSSAGTIPEVSAWASAIILTIPGQWTQEAWNTIASGFGSAADGKVSY